MQNARRRIQTIAQLHLSMLGDSPILRKSANTRFAELSLKSLVRQTDIAGGMLPIRSDELVTVRKELDAERGRISPALIAMSANDSPHNRYDLSCLNHSRICRIPAGSDADRHASATALGGNPLIRPLASSDIGDGPDSTPVHRP